MEISLTDEGEFDGSDTRWTGRADHPIPVSDKRDGLGADSKARAELVRFVAVERVRVVIGNVPFHLVDQLDDVLRLHV